MRSTGLSPFLLAAACASPEPTCLAGFELGEDGLCYAVADEAEPATVDDVLAAMEPCEPGSPGDRLDLPSGCADGACPGMTVDEIDAVLGEGGVCSTYRFEIDDYSFADVSCDWLDGALSTSFPDADLDGEIDAGSRSRSISVYLPWDGADGEGLGLDVAMSCYVEALGPPDRLFFARQPDGSWVVTSLSYETLGLYVDDNLDNKNGDWGEDGLVDRLALYGGQ